MDKQKTKPSYDIAEEKFYCLWENCKNERDEYAQECPQCKRYGNELVSSNTPKKETNLNLQMDNISQSPDLFQKEEEGQEEEDETKKNNDENMIPATLDVRQENNNIEIKRNKLKKSQRIFNKLAKILIESNEWQDELLQNPEEWKERVIWNHYSDLYLQLKTAVTFVDEEMKDFF